MVALVMPVKPVTDIVTFPPDTAVVGAVSVGAPSTVTDVVAVSTGVLIGLTAEPIVNDSV